MKKPKAHTYDILIERECPFCGNEEGLKLIPQTWRRVETYYVLCPYCRARGPQQLTKEKAMTSWNR